MHIFTKPFVTLFIFLSVTACVPWQAEYFKPLGDGKLSMNGCGGGPADKLNVRIQGDISTSIRAKLLKDNRLRLFVSFDVPEGSSIRLDSDHFFIHSGPIVQKMQIQRIQKLIPDNTVPIGIGILYLKPNDLLEGSTSKLSNFWGDYEVYEWYRLEFDRGSDSAPQDRFSIKYPAILINGALSDGPLIEFERAKEIFIYASNC